jgi:hypothetical protein
MTDYESLSKKGLRLSESDFNLIQGSLVSGAREAKKYLNVVSDDSWPKFIFGSDVDVLGYASQHDAISLSINHLNQADSLSTRLEYKDQLIMFVPDIFYMIVKYNYWLKLLGMESTIHRYQKIGNPLLKKRFPEKLPPEVSPKKLLLSDVEVEARTVTDAVITQLGENPIWKNFEVYLSKNYPQYYNKSIEELAKLPKIIFPISFEMEYYAI